MRPWEEALFINSCSNYNYFVELHDYLFACSNEVSALGAESLGPISTNSWRAWKMQASFLTHEKGFVLCLIFDFCSRGQKNFNPGWEFPLATIAIVSILFPKK